MNRVVLVDYAVLIRPLRFIHGHITSQAIWYKVYLAQFKLLLWPSLSDLMMLSTQGFLGKAPLLGIHPAAPFDEPYRDVILRSIDGVGFHMPQQFLEDASPIFADIVQHPPTALTLIQH
ncbi:hypothetical protein C8Q79DRAFT_1013868 [Trametes meyenii]|nr:hypothetical protein C8Q79DRAFT_1013868 [Trametes meyenii]